MQQPPHLRLLDSLVFNLLHMLPLFLRGIVVPNRRWTAFCARWLRDPVAVRFITRLRGRYGSDRFSVRLLEFAGNGLPRCKPILLLTGAADIAAVLSDPDSFGSDAVAKVERMSLFQPGAVIISGGEEAWRRRAFNESVLDTKCPIHRAAREFLEVVATEVEVISRADRIVRADIERMAGRITVQTVFGAGRGQHELTDMLADMIRRASRLWGFRKARVFDRYYRQLGEQLRDPEAGGLAGGCRGAGAGDVPVTAQVTHWLFAMKDALETHVPRALLLIVSHPDVEQRVRAEMAGVDPRDPEGIAGLHWLEGCVHEAVRLWTPVPLLLRRTTRPLDLNGAHVEAGTTVVIHAAFNHRDPHRYGDTANQFNPAQWVSGSPAPPMNHFSNGPRMCAGKPLALLLLKAILAGLLQRQRFIPESGALQGRARLPYLLNPFPLTFVRVPLPGTDGSDPLAVPARR